MQGRWFIVHSVIPSDSWDRSIPQRVFPAHRHIDQDRPERALAVA